MITMDFQKFFVSLLSNTISYKADLNAMLCGMWEVGSDMGRELKMFVCL